MTPDTMFTNLAGTIRAWYPAIFTFVATLSVIGYLFRDAELFGISVKRVIFAALLVICLPTFITFLLGMGGA